MIVNYNGLWKILIDKRLKKVDLHSVLHISPTTIAKMSKGQLVSLDTICKIAIYLNVDIGDVVSLKKNIGDSNYEI